MGAILIATLAASLYYLGVRAKITSWLWSRYPAWLTSFMDCSACTGFWYATLAAATVGRGASLSYLGLDMRELWTWPVIGLASIVTTPIVAGLMQRGLDAVGQVPTDAAG